MATQQTTERDDGVTTERTTTIQDNGAAAPARSGGATGLIATIAIIALLAIVGYFLWQANNREAVETDAVTNAAENVGEAAKDVGNAVEKAVE